MDKYFSLRKKVWVVLAVINILLICLECTGTFIVNNSVLVGFVLFPISSSLIINIGYLRTNTKSPLKKPHHKGVIALCCISLVISIFLLLVNYF